MGVIDYGSSGKVVNMKYPIHLSEIEKGVILSSKGRMAALTTNDRYYIIGVKLGDWNSISMFILTISNYSSRITLVPCSLLAALP